MVIAFEAGAGYKGKIYFSAMNMNGLFSFDPYTKTTELLSVFEKEKVSNWLHCQAFLCQDTMWLIPMRADYIAFVNLETKKIEYCDFQLTDHTGEDKPYYAASAIGDELYLFPYKSDEVLKIDMLSHEISVICCVSKELRDTMRDIFIYDGKMGVIDTDGEVRAEIRLDSGRVEKYEKKGNGNEGGYLSALQREEGALMIPFFASQMKKLSFLNGSIERRALTDNGLSLYRGVNVGNYAVLYPAGSYRKFARVEWDTLQMKLIDGKLKDGNNYVMAPGGWFEMQTVPADEGWWASSTDGFLLEFGVDGEVKGVYHAEADLQQLKKELECAYREAGVGMAFDVAGVTETETLGLEELIWFLKDE